jgi:ParB family chromosome partitioning protein
MGRRVLGKGLEALIPKSDSEKNEEFTYLAPEQIKESRYQPREKIDRQELEELAESIRENGFIQPVVVRKAGDNGYEMVAGSRRLMVAKSLGLSEIPTLIKELNDKDTFLIAITENLQRKNLNPIEQAKAFKKLMDQFELTQQEVGEILGKDRSSIANNLRLLNLPAPIQEALAQGVINAGQARSLLAVNDKKQQNELFLQIIDNKLTVRDIEKKTRKTSSSKGAKAKDPYVADMEAKFQEILGTKVKINHKKNNRGKVMIEYYSLDDLQRLIRRLK